MKTKPTKKNSAQTRRSARKRAVQPAGLAAELQARTLSPFRLMVLAVGISSVFVVLVINLAYLQIVPGAEKGQKFLNDQGDARTLRTQKINAYRGVITDRNGEILAVSTSVQSVWVDPSKMEKSRIPELAKVLGVATKELALKIGRAANKKFLYVKRHVPPKDAQTVSELNIEGVYLEEEFKRYYPAGEVAAHIVGFTNIDDLGQEGMELSMNSVLAGTTGEKQFVKDRKGNVVEDLGIIKAARSGSDVQLTIDLRLQYLAYRELKSAIARQGAVSGSVVMLDVATGEILAMANQPSFNPNNRSGIVANQLRNRAITDMVEPGSTMKPFAILAALETGRYFPNTVINTSPGRFTVPGKTYVDHRDYGKIDLTTIIQKSSQVGVCKIAMDLKPEQIRDVFSRVGLGQETNIGFPGEARGLLPFKQRWYPTEHAALAFGHGLSVTPLQLAQAYNVIANRGAFRPVTLIKQDLEYEAQQVIDPKYTQQVLGMLKKVVEKGGTATRADIDAYTVAGKTGTAHKVGSEGYIHDKYVALFAGVAPADHPEIVTVVVIDEPPVEHYYGGEAAAPVFANVVEGALRILNVPPEQGALAVN